ncbi:zinc finger protein 280D isoform X2 [Cynoglossus semilaevis]|uniref:zinc finger protein 280D isoform X2 n=1 Tax=Cynoglossus semilaevis TaxID=244447 RepID=UPI00049672A5|nr:zinc finger protein 280D isoform X2 [Cynoglossus semilaevis]
MSELFMECVEEDLEPWQKPTPEVHLIEDDDDDDEPIFVGVLSNDQNNREHKTLSTKTSALKEQCPPKSLTAGKHVASPLTTVTPKPVIINNQGFIVASPQLANTGGLIASLGRQYPPGTSFTIVPAGQQQVFQQVSTGSEMSGAVHRPQVQRISNNIVTLSNVKSPPLFGPQTTIQPVHSVNTVVSKTDQTSFKRLLPKEQIDNIVKRAKLDSGENGTTKKKCFKCAEEFSTTEALTCHIRSCPLNNEGKSPSAQTMAANKFIMLVADFYYGEFEGDWKRKENQKTNMTFKCQSCLKVLKNNIRFMNHMKHHLELEKQNSESWESHTTCQHCYRQYMTPFQLQCHIESAHSSIESSSNCKICELAFETEQVLLEHMKNHHKPGEMPYVCQVCNYRSSFFSDVETHFRTVHDNTKDLLCPFCLKVLRSGHMYMQHYMKHQKKGIHRCGKCRLNFLTQKERVEHKTHFHRTFRKPKALDGLPPGTKVTIRASLSGKNTVEQTSGRPAVTISPDFSPQTASPAGVSKSKVSMSGAAKGKINQNKKKDDRTSRHNLALVNLSINSDPYRCIECNSRIDDFFSHFPLFSSCGACKYQTSCKVSYGNHMIRFHSILSKSRKNHHKKKSTALKFTLVCLNCDLLVDASGGDLMTKHLTDRPSHVCKVIQEKIRQQKCCT